MSNSKYPEITFRHGPCSASIWATQRKGKHGTFMARSVTFQKRYKDRQMGEWKTSNTLFPDDIPKMVLVLNKAYEYLTSNNAFDPEDEQEELAPAEFHGQAGSEEGLPF